MMSLNYQTSAEGGEALAQRAVLLGEAVADLPAELVSAACERWARRERWMPRPSELLAEVAEVRRERDEEAQALGPKVAALRRVNRESMKAGRRTVLSEAGEMILMGGRGEMRGVRPDGSVIEPVWRERGWWIEAGDVALLRACYGLHGSGFRVSDAGEILG